MRPSIFHAAILLALTALVTVNGGFVLGKNKCNYGPAYWCADLSKAKGCGATSYCLQRSWQAGNKVVGKVQDSQVCTFCKDMVGDVKNFLTNNKTLSEIIEYLNRACAFMPDQFSKAECQKIEQHYLKEFIALIEKDLDPATICSLIRLCSKSQATMKLARVGLAKPKTPIRKLGDSAACDACKGAVKYAMAEIDNKQNQATMKTVLETECQKLGGDLAPECKFLVDLFLPKMIAVLDQELTPQLCSTLHMCNSTSNVDVVARARTTLIGLLQQQGELKTHVIGVASRVGADYCTVCEEVVNYVKIFISNNETKQMVMDFIENDVCSQMGEFSSMCKETVKEYFPKIWTEFLAALDAKKLCTEVGLCTATSAAVAQPSHALQPSTIKASPQCILCEFVVEKLVDTLLTNKSEAAIISAVENVCKIFPRSLRSDCDKFIAKYGAKLIKALVSGTAPKAICSLLQLCSSGKLDVVQLPKLKGGNCMMCELAMGYVKSALAKNATQQEVMAALKKVCGDLPADMAKVCDAATMKYGPQLLSMLAKDIDAKKVCAEIGMCSGMKARLGKPDGLVHLYNMVGNSND